MFALRRHARAVATKATTIDVIQKLEHDHSRLLRVVKKRIDDRKYLDSKVLECFVLILIDTLLTFFTLDFR